MKERNLQDPGTDYDYKNDILFFKVKERLVFCKDSGSLLKQRLEVYTLFSKIFLFLKNHL